MAVEQCELCDKVKDRVHYNKKIEMRICRLCYNTEVCIAECAFCKREKRVALRIDAGPVCPCCYYRVRERYPCDECERVKAIQAHGLCPACYQRKEREKKKALVKEPILASSEVIAFPALPAP